MLNGRGAGRGKTLLNNPDQLAELGYRFEERAAIIEYAAGLPRDEAQRLAWADIEAQLDAIDPRQARARGATEHWRPFKPDRDALAQ
jgi:hypothetical protein